MKTVDIGLCLWPKRCGRNGDLNDEENSESKQGHYWGAFTVGVRCAVTCSDVLCDSHARSIGDWVRIRY